ncbi:MAG: phage GP46 family protein [Thermodesulfobacteriota bacterium]
MDIALEYNPDERIFDLIIKGGDLATDEGLETAVILSLFTDRRAEEDDDLPGGSSDRRGWWADAYFDRPHGSRLWLLGREKEQDSVLRRAKTYADEALQWLVDDGVAKEVVVDAEHVRRGVLGIDVSIRRGSGADLERQYEYVWDAIA